MDQESYNLLIGAHIVSVESEDGVAIITLKTFDGGWAVINAEEHTMEVEEW